MNLNTKLLIVLIVLVCICIAVTVCGNHRGRMDRGYFKNYEKVATVTNQNYDTEIQWATANDSMPLGWERWNDTMVEIPVEKFGPVGQRISYMIRLNAKMVSGIDQKKMCTGDSEMALCAIGDHPEVIRYFNAITYRD